MGIDYKKRLSLILARLEHEAKIVTAAKMLASGNDYCDFFVENNNGGPFHEKCPDDAFLGLNLKAKSFSKNRMKDLSKLRSTSKDDYPDFFVEGSGPAWHEKINDFGIREQLVQKEQRAFALRRSQVLQTFTRIAENASEIRVGK